MYGCWTPHRRDRWQVNCLWVSCKVLMSFSRFPRPIIGMSMTSIGSIQTNLLCCKIAHKLPPSKTIDSRYAHDTHTAHRDFFGASWLFWLFRLINTLTYLLTYIPYLIIRQLIRRRNMSIKSLQGRWISLLTYLVTYQKWTTKTRTRKLVP